MPIAETSTCEAEKATLARFPAPELGACRHSYDVSTTKRFSRSLPCVSLLFVIGCSGDPAPGEDSVGTAGSSVAGQPGASGAAVGGSAGLPTVPLAGQVSTAGSTAAAGQPNSAGAGGVTAGGTGSGGTVAAAGAAAGLPGSAGMAGGAAGGLAGAPSGGSGGGSGGSAATSGSGGGTSMDPLAFYATTCSVCHGAKGEGVVNMGPEIQHPVRDYSTWVVRNGRMGHPSFKSSVMPAMNAAMLPDATLNAIYDAFSTPALPKPSTGKALYEDFCQTCHSATGTGGTAAHNVKGQTLSKAISMVRSGHSLTAFGTRNAYMPKWSAAELSDAEVGLIMDYVGTL